MEEWIKITEFAHGVVYASGNKRKLVIPNHPDIFFETDTKEVTWQPGTGGR
jgi:hypothetical protein